MSPGSDVEFKPSDTSSRYYHMPPVFVDIRTANYQLKAPDFDADKESRERNKDQKRARKKQLNLTASQASELMRRFTDLERAHYDLQQKHGRQGSRLEECLLKLNKWTQLKENVDG